MPSHYVDLEDALIVIKPGVGNCNTRRSLRRIIELKIKNESFYAQANSKTRRRFQRVLQILKPDPTLRDRLNDVEKAKKMTDKSTKSQEKDQNQIKPDVPPPIPHIAFIGQLTFETTIDEIEQFLRQNGITGNIAIRLRRDSTTQKSLGMGFIEVEGPRELNKLLSLHKSYLNGRKVNIEKSCGGKSKITRTTKILTKREQQEQLRQVEIENILDEYERKGVIRREELSEKVSSMMSHLMGNELQHVSASKD